MADRETVVVAVRVVHRESRYLGKPDGMMWFVDQRGQVGREYMVGSPLGRQRNRAMALEDFRSIAECEYNYHAKKQGKPQITMRLEVIEEINEG